MGFRRSLMAGLRAAILLILIQGHFAYALWGSGRTASSVRSQDGGLEPSNTASQLLRSGSHSPSSYELALNELQQLEAEPLCHRIAARLLVNNCQLLEGKDEATVLTDSGHKIRDFVDSFAASLAICDLERGKFDIPRECTMFREPALSQLPLLNVPRLHVTSGEIDGCLSGLGASDSTWNTWVSYRHKAVRFCEAARADNERAQNILLYQRLTKIMGKLTDDTDERYEQRMKDLDFRAQATGDKIDSLSPQLDQLHDGMRTVESFLSGDLMRALKDTTNSVHTGVENAANLQRMLKLILKGIVDGHAEAASVHENALQVMGRQAESEMQTVMAVMAAAVASTTTLQNQIELSFIQAAQLETRQDSLEEGMQRLVDISEDLSKKHDQHTHLLYQAQNLTNDILDSLEDTAASAALVGESFSRQSSATSWWPYIWCPAASLVMGSYGLPPSAIRNLGLVVLGETAGFIISSIQSLSLGLSSFSTTGNSPSSVPTEQSSFDSATSTNLNSTY